MCWGGKSTFTSTFPVWIYFKTAILSIRITSEKSMRSMLLVKTLMSMRLRSSISHVWTWSVQYYLPPTGVHGVSTNCGPKDTHVKKKEDFKKNLISKVWCLSLKVGRSVSSYHGNGGGRCSRGFLSDWRGNRAVDGQRLRHGEWRTELTAGFNQSTYILF